METSDLAFSLFQPVVNPVHSTSTATVLVQAFYTSTLSLPQNWSLASNLSQSHSLPQLWSCHSCHKGTAKNFKISEPNFQTKPNHRHLLPQHGSQLEESYSTSAQNSYKSRELVPQSELFAILSFLPNLCGDLQYSFMHPFPSPMSFFICFSIFFFLIYYLSAGLLFVFLICWC